MKLHHLYIVIFAILQFLNCRDAYCGTQVLEKNSTLSVVDDASIDSTTIKSETYLQHKQLEVSSAYSIDSPVDFSLSGMHLIADKNSLLHDVEFVASILRKEDTEVLDNLMINTTGGCYAYRLLPHGTHFSKPASLELAYEPLALPSGFRPEDIYTYYYDNNLRSWQRLERIKVDTIQHVVVSLTTHFTDFINAVIRTPEMPEMSTNIPTQMSDMAAPHPFEHLAIVSAPEINNYGSAKIIYPIEIPKGRNGLQPDVSLTYNSANGNGLLGYGWSMLQSAITIDTRWGVPRYDASYETEIYTLDGMQCVLKDGNPDLKLPYQTNIQIVRKTGKVNFVARDTKNCDKIIRYGDNPKNYWWEVVGRDGTIRYYGKYAQDKIVNSNCVLKDAHGNIGYWALAEIVDISGNYIRYEYNVSSNSEIYPKTIYYTGHKLADGSIDMLPSYHIYFHYDERLDILRDGRLGFVRQTDSIVRCIDITHKYNGQAAEPILKYRNHLFVLEYDNTDNTSLLTQIQDAYWSYDDSWKSILYKSATKINGITKFDYHTSSFDSIFSTSDIIISFDDASYMPLSMSENRSGNLGGTATVGLGQGLWNTNLSAGGNYNFSKSSGQTNQMLLDINGDGLPDLVYIKNNIIHFKLQKNSNDTLCFLEEHSTNIPAKGLSLEYSKTNTWGLQTGVETIGISANVSGGFSYTDSYTSCYFSDINNDGLPDYIDDGKVYFNRLNSYGNFIAFDGEPQVVIDSTTCNNNFYYDGEVEIVPDCIVRDSIVSQFQFSPSDCSMEYNGTPPNHQDNTLHDSWYCEICDQAIQDYISSGLCPIELYSVFANTASRMSLARSGESASVDEMGLEEIVQHCLLSCDAELPCIECLEFYHVPEMQDAYEECKRENGCRTLCSECVHYLFDGDETGYLQCADQYCLNGTLYAVNTQCTDCEAVCVDDITHCKECILENPTCMVCQECIQECIDGPQTCMQCKMQNNCLGAISDECWNECLGDEVDMTTCGTCLLDHGVYCEECEDTCRDEPHLCRSCINRHCYYDETEAYFNECVQSEWDRYYAWLDELQNDYPYIQVNKQENTYFAHHIDTICPEKTDPEIEAIRVWVAPKTGWVTLRTTIQLVQDTTQNRLQARQVDGVRCLIQHNHNISVDTNNHILQAQESTILDVYDITADDYQQKNNTYNIYVKQGDVFFFHLRSYRTHNFDNVNWEQTFTYENGDYYSSVDDYICSSDAVFQAADDGTLILTTDIACQTNTTAQLKILLNHQVIDSIAISPSITYNQKTLLYPSESSFSLELWSDNNLGEIEVRPRLTYAPMNNMDSAFTQWLAPRAVFTREVELDSTYYHLFGPLYRGWGQFAYNNIDAVDIIPIESLVNSVQSYAMEIPSDSATFYQSITFTATDTLQLMQEGGLEDAFNDRNLYNPLDNAWIQMSADISQYSWEAYGRVARNARHLLSNTRNTKAISSVLGIENTNINEAAEDVEYDSDVPVLMDGQRVTTVRKTSKTKQWNVNAGIGIVNNGVGRTHSESDYAITTDFMDMNGDGYPDVVRSSTIQYTMPWGGLGGNISVKNFDAYSNHSISTGNSLSGNYAYAVKAPGVNIRDGKFLSHVNGSLGGSQTSTFSQSTVAYMDINADGLPDKLIRNGDSLLYCLNIGYSFDTPRELIDISLIDRNNSVSFGGNLGTSGDLGWGDIKMITQNILGTDYPTLTSKYQMSIALGADINWSHNTLSHRLIDMNGDGVLDKVEKTSDGFIISLVSTQGVIDSTTVANGTMQQSTTLNWSINAGITFGFPIMFIKACIGLSGSPLGKSTTQVTHDLVDMNGDGLLDLVWVENDGIHIRYNQLGKKNLLKTITNPTGQSFLIDYELSEPTYQRRGRHWLMKSVADIDPHIHPMLGCDTMIRTFSYADPYYDYAERQFLGYGTTTTYDINTDSIPYSVYRKIIRRYNNQDFVEHGKMLYEGVLDAEDNVFREYELSTWYVDSTLSNTDDLCHDASIRVGAEVHYTRYYEGGNERIVTAKKYEYDKYHNVRKYINFGDSILPNDDLRAEIEYDSTDIDTHNLVSSPTKVTIYNAEIANRELQAEYQKGYITELRKIDLLCSHTDTTNYHYDIYGLLDSIILPSNHKGERTYTIFEYDTLSHTLPTKMIDNLGRVTQRDYDTLWQNISTHQDPSGSIWQYSYDTLCRLVKIELPTQDTISISYSPPTNPYAYTYLSCLDFNLYTYYDSRGNVLYHKKRHLGESWVFSDINAFDCFERVATYYQNHIDSRNEIDSTYTLYPCHYTLSTDSLHSLKELTWDVLDRPLRTAWMDGTHNVYHYSIDTDAFGVKRLKQMYTDEKGYSQQQYSAPQGWVTTSILPENTVTTFVYDALGQLQQSTDPDGLTTLYQYDGLGRKISRHHPDAGMTQWSYDNLGNITSSATQRQINEGTNTIYEYDYDRLVSIHHPQYPQLNSHYEYDSVGRLAKRTDIAGYESFQYDVFGNVSETDRLFVIPTENYACRFRTRFNYDALGRITCITYPDGEQVMYSYIAGRLSRISSGNNTYLSEIKYNPYEKPICYHFGNGYTTEYTYDSTRLWMTRQKNYNANYLLQDLRYVYDAIGNIHYIEQIADSVGWLGGEYILDYQYDSLSRLIRTDMSSHYFGNYANYNMTYSSSGLVGEKICNDMPWDYQYGYKFNSNGYLQNHQLQCIYDNITGENTALQWDANGQLLNILRPCQGDIRHHWWDEQGHLAAFVDNEQCGYYGYDGNGERVYKLTGQALLDQYNAGEPTFQMYFRDAVLYVNPYMVVTPRGYTKHYYNGNQRIAARIGKLEDLPDDIIVNSDTVAVERINNVREYMTSLLNTLDMQDVDTTGIIADIAGNSISGEQCDYSPLFSTSVYCDSNILYPILSKDSTELAAVDGLYYYHSDHLGSATWITNSVGTPVEYIHYMPYGELWVDQQATGYGERFKFTGKERDSESGYDYFGARYYSSTLPTWLSVDPLSDKYPHISPYAYCAWNPINKIDPDGKDDVFSENGHYLRRIDNGTDFTMIEDRAGNLKNITNYDYNQENIQARQMLKNVATYYAAQVNLNQAIGIFDNTTTEEGAFACTFTKTQQVSMVLSNGKLSPYANTGNNIMNALVHETAHAIYGKKSDIDAILHQIAHPTWNKTTDAFQHGVINYLVNNANKKQLSVNNPSIQQIQSILNQSTYSIFYNNNEFVILIQLP